jgi:hypothetical protein
MAVDNFVAQMTGKSQAENAKKGVETINLHAQLQSD